MVGVSYGKLKSSFTVLAVHILHVCHTACIGCIHTYCMYCCMYVILHVLAAYILHVVSFLHMQLKVFAIAQQEVSSSDSKYKGYVVQDNAEGLAYGMFYAPTLLLLIFIC